MKESAMKALGLDMHGNQFVLEVLTARGQVAQRVSRPTSARELIDVVQAIRGPKTLVVEESHLAQWVKRTIEPYVDRLIICDPKRNHWIAKDEFNDDQSSAHKLAKLFQGGYLKEIQHPESKEESLRRLFQHYYDLNHQLTRFKNKLKATFRGEAIGVAGQGIYEEDQHEAWLKKLRKQKHLQHAARQRFELVDQLERLKDETSALMIKAARKNKGFKWIESIPGVGEVLTAGYLALIETPHRFSRKNKLWKYGGFSNKRHTSDDVVYVDGASNEGNRALKWVVVQHFQAAVIRSRPGANRFRRKYDELQRKGLNATAARRMVCRALLSTVRAVWMKEELYRDR